CQQYNSDPYSF
nr:immunoglobulin light chain junction region [Macaca mulatta]MOV74234.1 immunoglobulin light chain junction region [Macaca mulatta]MOV74253.1 immunoglobulin light chain junction region [Macaca mulatta]MOV74282.1 immunoglobulin light chain junction region [Macaca mulatta]MOV74297.1 immunoglobulin light chain junction region [Macaca mulatta]